MGQSEACGTHDEFMAELDARLRYHNEERIREPLG